MSAVCEKFLMHATRLISKNQVSHDSYSEVTEGRPKLSLSYQVILEFLNRLRCSAAVESLLSALTMKEIFSLRAARTLCPRPSKVPIRLKPGAGQWFRFRTMVGLSRILSKAAVSMDEIAGGRELAAEREIAHRIDRRKNTGTSANGVVATADVF